MLRQTVSRHAVCRYPPSFPFTASPHTSEQPLIRTYTAIQWYGKVDSGCVDLRQTDVHTLAIREHGRSGPETEFMGQV